jgi:large subunit ribosomal protein L46
VNMNTWIVGRVPIGHTDYKYAKGKKNEASGVQEVGEKTFFLRGRIMAGQADLKGNKFGITDWKWLTKDEIEGTVSLRYWSGIKNMLPEQ